MKFVFWGMALSFFIYACVPNEIVPMWGFLILTWVCLGIGCIVHKIEELK